MNKIEINIDNYLSEEDKKEIAIEEFRRIVRENTLEKFKQDSRVTNKKMSDYERIISNSIFYYLEGEIDSLIGQDTKKLIREGVEKTIKKQDYSYSMFRRKSAWEMEESPAQKVVLQAISENQEYIKSKVLQKIDENIDSLSTKDTLENISEIFYTIIEDKLKK